MSALLQVDRARVDMRTVAGLRELGYTVVAVPDSSGPAITQVGADRRFEAAKAVLKGMLASDATVDRTTVGPARWADVAVRFADALIERLDRGD